MDRKRLIAKKNALPKFESRHDERMTDEGGLNDCAKFLAGSGWQPCINRSIAASKTALLGSQRHDIRTGERSLLTYLFSTIDEIRPEARTER